MKLFPRLPLGLSHLKKHCFRHNFQECLHPLGTCSIETNSVKAFAIDFESLSEKKFFEILLHGDSRCDDNQNNSILSASINLLRKLKVLIVPFFVKITFFHHFQVF